MIGENRTAAHSAIESGIYLKAGEIEPCGIAPLAVHLSHLADRRNSKCVRLDVPSSRLINDHASGLLAVSEPGDTLSDARRRELQADRSRRRPSSHIIVRNRMQYRQVGMR